MNRFNLPENAVIISKTDLLGNIIEVNEDFVSASGYLEEELIGQPHNILRCELIPSVIFKDLWETISKGNSWSNIVVNKRKNGDVYWVVANVSPLLNENKEITGYISIRYPANEEQISLAKKIYQDIKNNW